MAALHDSAEGLRRFVAMLRADFLQRSRSTRFWLLLAGTAAVSWLCFPLADAGYAIVAVGQQYRGAYSSAWVGMVLAMVSVLLSLAGFYMVRGTLVRDFDSRVWQLLVSTPMTRRGYLLAKWCSHMSVFLCMLAVSLAVGLLAQWVRAEDRTLDLWELVKPSLLLALPGLALTATLAIWFDMLPWLRRSLGNVVYFFLWMTLLSVGMVNAVNHKPADGSHPWLSDINGVALLERGLQRLAAPQMPGMDTRSLCIGCGAMHPPLRRFAWPSWQVDARDLPGRAFWLLLALAGVLAAAPWLDRCAARTTPAGAGATALGGRPLRWLDRVTAPLQHGRTGLLLAAELRLELRQRRLWWWLAMLAAAGVQLFAPRQAASLAVLASWLLLMDVFSRGVLREHDSGTAALLFCSAGARGHVLLARALTLLALAWGFTLPALLRFLLAADVASALAVVVLGASVALWGLALGALTRNPRAHELLLCLLAYVTLQGPGALDVASASHASTWWHAAGLPLAGALVLAAWPRLHR